MTLTVTQSNKIQQRVCEREKTLCNMAAAEDDMAGLLDWLEAEPAALGLDVRLQKALLCAATEHSEAHGLSETGLPILTTTAVSSLRDGRSGGGIWQAMKRAVRSALGDSQSIADWLWLTVGRMQYAGTVSADAQRGRQGRRGAGNATRALWRDGNGLSAHSWPGLVHKAYELVLQVSSNPDLDRAPCLPIQCQLPYINRLKHWLHGVGSTRAIRAMWWVLTATKGVQVSGLELSGWDAEEWASDIDYYHTLGYDTSELETVGAQISGWQQAALAPAAGSVQYTVNWCAGWPVVFRRAMQKYGREVIAVDCRVLDDSHAHNIQLDVLTVAPRYLRHEVARLSGVQVDQLRENWGGVPCTTFSRSDSSNKRRKRLRDGGYGAMQWNNYRDGKDPVRRPMHAAGTVKGDAAREGDRIAEVILWVCRHSGESWAIENPLGQLRYRPYMQKVSKYLARLDYCKLWSSAERSAGFEWQKASCVWTRRWDKRRWNISDSNTCHRDCECGEFRTTAGSESYVHRGQVEDAGDVAAHNGLEVEEAKCR